MKRAGHLIELIADMDNLREAFLRASRGKSLSREVIAFRENMENELWQIHCQLLDGTYHYGDYHQFVIYDPNLNYS